MQMSRFAISLFDFVKVYTIDGETRPAADVNAIFM